MSVGTIMSVGTAITGIRPSVIQFSSDSCTLFQKLMNIWGVLEYRIPRNTVGMSYSTWYAKQMSHSCRHVQVYGIRHTAYGIRHTSCVIRHGSCVMHYARCPYPPSWYQSSSSLLTLTCELRVARTFFW